MRRWQYTVKALAKVIPVHDEIIRAGLARVEWPGRLQLIDQPGGQKILLDGAHNLGSAEVLRSAVRTYFAAQSPAMILGILGDKDWLPMCHVLAPLAPRIFLVPVASRRSSSPEQLLMACREANSSAEIVECQMLGEALELTRKEFFVLITGSLYLVGEAMERLSVAPAAAVDERDLNEWHPNVAHTKGHHV